MKTRRSVAAMAALWFAPALPGLEAGSVTPAPPAARLADEASGLAVVLQVEPLAGERLVAGSFSVAFIADTTPTDAVFGDGFESP
jgi:hypothetical protein